MTKQKSSIKPRMKHRTVGPRKGTGSIDVSGAARSKKRPPRRYRLQLDKDTYEYFMKHGELPREDKPFSFTLSDFLKKK